MYTYRVDYILLQRQAAAWHSANFASYVACREGWLSVKAATQNLSVIINYMNSSKILSACPNAYRRNGTRFC